MNITYYVLHFVYIPLLSTAAIGLGGAAAVAIGIFTGIACIVAIAIIAICTLIAIRHYKRRTTNIRVSF